MTVATTVLDTKTLQQLAFHDHNYIGNIFSIVSFGPCTLSLKVKYSHSGLQWADFVPLKSNAQNFSKTSVPLE